MRWVTFRRGPQHGDRVGVVVDSQVHVLPDGVTLLGLLGDGLAAAGEKALRDPVEVVSLDEVTLRSPIPQPPTVRDFYACEQHVKTARKRRGLEMDPDWYELPVFYFSNPYAVNGEAEPVAIPPGSSELDFELEVAAIIGRGGSDLTPQQGEESIAGFCVMNDWSARDIQRREMKLSMGPVKGKDSATTLGPMLVTPDELEDTRSGRAYDLTMTAAVNGREYSRASLAEIYWSFGELISYASRGTRVQAGDVIGSGTCGTGCILELALVHGADAYPWLQPGDDVVLSVDRLGSLHNRIVAGAPVQPLR